MQAEDLKDEELMRSPKLLELYDDKPTSAQPAASVTAPLKTPYGRRIMTAGSGPDVKKPAVTRGKFGGVIA